MSNYVGGGKFDVRANTIYAMFSLHSPLIVPQIPALLPHSLPQEHPRVQRAARQQGLERLLQPPGTHLRGRHQAEARLQDKQERFASDGQDN